MNLSLFQAIELILVTVVSHVSSFVSYVHCTLYRWGMRMYRFIVHVGDEYVLLGSTSHGTVLYRWGMSMYCLVQLAVELYCTGVLYRWGMSMYFLVQLAMKLYCTSGG